jgi:hypothetical protein
MDSLSLRTPGIVLNKFYLLGFTAIRTGQPRKASLDNGHDHAVAVVLQLFQRTRHRSCLGALRAPGFESQRRSLAYVVCHVLTGCGVRSTWE